VLPLDHAVGEGRGDGRVRLPSLVGVVSRAVAVGDVDDRDHVPTPFDGLMRLWWQRRTDE
jgi:hypothetical protein